MLVVLVIGYFYFKDTNLSLLISGYSNNEIKEIKQKLNDEQINTLLKYKKLNNIIDLINHKNFKEENLEEYINIINQYSNWDIDVVIEVINKNITDLETVDQFINNENFKTEKLLSYINYYTNNNVSIEKTIDLVNKNIDFDQNTYSPIIDDIMNEKYFIDSRLDRYLNYYEKNQNKSPNEIVSVVNSNADYAFYSKTEISDLSKDNLVLVNKFYSLPSNYEPDDLVTIESPYGIGQLRKEAYEQFKKMYRDAEKENLKINIVSAYRSYSKQKNLYEKYVQNDGKALADTYSARPGHSEHQTGLTIDVVIDEEYFKNTDEFRWLQKNAHKYGFILRYPEKADYITGYMFEPWHYRYVGVDAATEIYNLGITFDEYYTFFIE